MKGVQAVLSVNKTTDHEAQALTYMKLGSWHVGLLLNFNVSILKYGIKRLVYKLDE